MAAPLPRPPPGGRAAAGTHHVGCLPRLLAPLCDKLARIDFVGCVDGTIRWTEPAYVVAAFTLILADAVVFFSVVFREVRACAVAHLRVLCTSA